MGGNIAVTIRREDGREHRMCRWTNPIPHTFKNIHFLNGNEEYLDRYIKTWDDFVEDYRLHKEDGEFEHNMTSVYAPYPFLAPSEYGIIVVDYQKKVIISCNHYTSLGYIDGVNYLIELPDDPPYTEAFKIPTPDEEGDFAVCQNLAHFISEDRIKSVISWDNEVKEKLPLDFFINTPRREQGEVTRELRFELDLKPFTLFDFNRDTPEIFAKVKEKVLELGFKLTPEEEEIWEKEIKGREEDE